MKKTTKTIVLILCTFCSVSISKVNAQSIDTSTTKKLLNYIMQPLNKSQIPTGFLQELGCPMLPMATFNGTLTDSNKIDMNLWRTLYYQLQTSYCGSSTNPLPSITEVNNSIKTLSSSSLPTPIPILIGQYNSVKSNAFTGNLLSYNAALNQVFDVANRSQSPYQLNNLFAAAPNLSYTKTGTETFICSSSLIWNNTGRSVSKIEIDFADSRGFQIIQLDNPISISYSTTGLKIWKIRITLNDNYILQCNAGYYVAKAASNIAARYTNANTFTWSNVSVINGGQLFGATVNLCFSRNAPTSPRRIRKPLIIVEGYDVSAIAPNIQDNYNVRSFIDAINDPIGYDFNQQLDDIAGYDLIFIDFWNGAADIVGNAMVVQEVIRLVNSVKVVDNRFGNIRQQNVVMGLSMGGLCARYALADMTKRNQNSETKLLITHDSPHKGANVPLGLQYLIQMMGNFEIYGTGIRDIYPQYDEALDLLNAPATQQMLTYRATGTNTFVANTFLESTYRNMVTFRNTDPQPTYRFIATANGNECAHPVTNPSYTYFNFGAGIGAGVEVNLLFFKIPIVSYYLDAQAEANALPVTGSTAKIARLFTRNQLQLFGFINIFKQLYDNTAFAPGNHLPIDGVPGSTSSVVDVTQLAAITNLPAFNINLNVAFPIYGLIGGYVNTYAYNSSNPLAYTFVSVPSALDVIPYNNNTFAEKYVNGTNQNFPSTSENFIAQETNNTGTSNNAHIRFTARNSRWLFNEMEELPNLVNCSNECSNPYSIQGESMFCNSSNYSIKGLPRGASVVWSSTPNSVVTIGCQNCLSTNVNRATDGIIELKATLSNVCTSTNNVLVKSIIVGTGAPVFMLNNITPQPSPVAGVPSLILNLEVSYVPRATSYRVFLNGLPWAAYNGGGRNVGAGFVDIGGYKLPKCGTKYNVRIDAITPCGNMTVSAANVQQMCNGRVANRFSANQHPTVANTLTIGVKQYTEDELAKLFFESSALNVEKVQTVKMFNKEGELVLSNENIGLQLTNIDISSLTQGTYSIEISGNNDYKEQQTFQYVTTSSLEQLAEAIANNTLNILSPEANELMNVLQQELYQQLRENSDLLTNSTTLQNFFISREQGGFGKIEEINSALSNYDIAAAQALINNWLPSTQLELNSLAYYNFFIKYLNGTAFSTTDISNLYSLSNLCPRQNGEVIYAARSLYNYIAQAEESFETACNTSTFARGVKQIGKQNTKTVSNNFVIYPNPTKDNFNIKFPSVGKGINTIKVIDMFGKTLIEKNTISGTQNINITQPLAKGIYTVQITNSATGKTETQKLIIQ